jgi:transposase-like protein
MEAVRYFADEDRTLETMVSLRWPNGVHCPTCGRTDVRFIATRKLWECKEKHPRKQFSAKVGTIFEDSGLPLDKWFVAVWSIANCKNGISSYELARAIGVTQKSAWHMLHRIRLAMEIGGFDKFDGITEADETFIGPKPSAMHKDRREKHRTAAYHYEKSIVMGVLERQGERAASRVRALPIRDTNAKNLHRVVRETVTPGATLHTDSAHGYRALAPNTPMRQSITPWSTFAATFIRTGLRTSGAS